MSAVKPAAVRYYFDANLLGPAKLLATLRPDITYPTDPGGVVNLRERPACPVADPAVPDCVWIPIVAAEGWLILTRDRMIQQHLAEINAVKENQTRMVALTSAGTLGAFDQPEIIFCQCGRSRC